MSSPSMRHEEGCGTASPSVDDVLRVRLRRVIETHFDPVWGSRFWLDRARTFGLDARRDVREASDLALLGEMSPDDLASRPLLDFVPRRFHDDLRSFTVCQTGGATGPGKWTAYRADELNEAFVAPFVAAATHLRFPNRQPWLFVGPSGPHVIGKVVRHLAMAMDSPEPFSVDFDPRWARRLADGTFARRRYLAHVVEQAMDIIGAQEISVLFATPPVLVALADQMTRPQRLRIRAVHYGGLPVSPEQMRQCQEELFPNALHVSGYGNTLFGCCLELHATLGRQIDYFPHGNRLLLEVVDDEGVPIEPGAGAHVGQVRVTRLDESFLIVRMRERDQAASIVPPAHAPPGFLLPGVHNPRPAASPGAVPVVGLY